MKMSDAKASKVEANKNTKDYSELVILSSEYFPACLHRLIESINLSKINRWSNLITQRIEEHVGLKVKRIDIERLLFFIHIFIILNLILAISCSIMRWDMTFLTRGYKISYISSITYIISQI